MILFRGFVKFTPNDNYILVSSMEDLIKLWDYNSGKYVRVYKGHKCRHYSIYLSFSYDGNEIISGSGIFINIYYYRRW